MSNPDQYNFADQMRAPPDAPQSPPAEGATPADALERWRAAMFGTAPRFAGVVATTTTADPQDDATTARVAAAEAWMSKARQAPPGFEVI